MQRKKTVDSGQLEAASALSEERKPDKNGPNYTEDEIEYADGEGTPLNEEFDIPDKEDVEDDFDGDIDVDD